MQSGELDLALTMLETHAMRLLADARMRLLARWLGSVPAGRLAEHPVLQVVHAWAVNFTSGPNEALALLGSLGEGRELDAEPQAYLLALKMLLLVCTDRIEEAYEAGLRRMSGFPCGTASRAACSQTRSARRR